MNSVLQQFFMLKGIKEGVLEAEEACTYPNEDFLVKKNWNWSLRVMIMTVVTMI